MLLKIFLVSLKKMTFMILEKVNCGAFAVLKHCFVRKFITSYFFLSFFPSMNFYLISEKISVIRTVNVILKIYRIELSVI